MARERSPNRDKAKTLYLSANGEIKLTDIAAQLNVSDSQIRKWKSTDKWDNELNGALPKENGKVKGNVTNKKVTEKKIKKEPIELVNGENVDNPTGSDLTEKQWLFCLYYTQLFNATKAYQKAYGCKYETAMVEGCKHLRKPKIYEPLLFYTPQLLCYRSQLMYLAYPYPDSFHNQCNSTLLRLKSWSFLLLKILSPNPLRPTPQDYM